MPLSHVVEVSAWVHEEGGEGPLVANWRWASALVSQDQVEQLAEGWFHALAMLAQYAASASDGGLSPSDIQLTGLTQSEIDYLQRRFTSRPVGSVR
jgi:non-ribosomal peptide synthase protein (TIGR01720 family)